VTRVAVLQEVKGKLPLDELVAVYKCGDGRDWYLTFTRVETAMKLSDETFGTCVVFNGQVDRW
jgi:hypothetical protein